MTKEHPFVLNKYGRATGYVKFFDAKKALGFITKEPEILSTERGKHDVLFYATEFKARHSIAPGKLVEFRLIETDRGLQAWDGIVIDYLPAG